MANFPTGDEGPRSGGESRKARQSTVSTRDSAPFPHQVFADHNLGVVLTGPHGIYVKDAFWPHRLSV